MAWSQHVARVSNELHESDSAPDPEEMRPKVEPWVSALLQSEQVAVLVGNGLTTAVAGIAGVSPPSMKPVTFSAAGEDDVNAYAKRTAEAMDRGDPNIEDQLRAAMLLQG